ncbi:MAG: hypothetical protein QQN55_00965 [Nitrosopumilus sp.]
MSIIKRIKVQESIDNWNDNNPIKFKKTAITVGESIGVAGRSFSLWNTGEVSKQIQCLYNISKVLDCNFDDLFEFEYISEYDKVVLKRIALTEAIEIWNKTRRKMSINRVSILVNYAFPQLKNWNDGTLPFPIVNFFNFCKELEVKQPSKILEF